MQANHTINIRGKIIELDKPKIMGIINVTPDSFFSGSRKVESNQILKTAASMLKTGATFLDIGGYSSRPNASDVSQEEELKRVIDPIKAIMKEFPDTLISIDTFRSEVAKRAIEAGAALVNDISAGHLDKLMLKTVAQLKVPYIAMHSRGTPQTMNTLTDYTNIIVDITNYFSKVIYNCNLLGIKDVLIDIGFGFSKTVKQSFELLKNLDYFHHLDKPLLIGISRKSMIYQTLHSTAEEALNGTSILHTVALLKGGNILRVHDVKEAVEAVKLITELD